MGAGAFPCYQCGLGGPLLPAIPLWNEEPLYLCVNEPKSIMESMLAIKGFFLEDLF